jgi:D-sedoheptulose 7-phosphate isomerase|tara:strand:+ start:162 stop:755 length:594 start_codon:yes stop_codon:yes gene_type:complete
MEDILTKERAQIVNELISRVIRAHQKFLSLDQTPLLKASQVIHDAFIRENKLLLFGNGGSASDAQHVAAEFVGRFMRDRNALPAIALTADTSVVTAVANDYGYEHVFARQIEALGRSGDVVIGISTSGESSNVLAAFKVATQRGLTCIGLTGLDGGVIGQAADIHIVAPDDSVPCVQELHRTILHIICQLVEQDQES